MQELNEKKKAISVELPVSDDFCEHQHEEAMYWYNTACGNHIGELVYNRSYTHCPYCGKRIKLVEESKNSR